MRHPEFDGATYDHARDFGRLKSTLARTYACLLNGEWWSLRELALAVGCTEAGVSARLRDLRKDKFKRLYPNHSIESTYIVNGFWRYRMRRT